MVRISPVYKYDCDVIIAGGGPSGSALAYYLAKQNIKVIVVEAKKFPRDKICGDAVSAVALSELHKMGITGLEAFSKVNEINDVALFIEQEKITVDLERSEKLPFRGRVIPRLKLDTWIYEAAKNAGAQFIEGARVVNYETSENLVSVELKNGAAKSKLKSKIIIGADGSNSTVSRKLNGDKPSDRYQLLGLRVYYENINGPSDRCDIFFTGDNFPGLFWLFPVGTNTANIGSAMIASTLPPNKNHVTDLLQKQFRSNKSFAERVGGGKMKGKVQGWPLTFQDPKSTIIGNRVLLVGDAAGLINPLSGDGIQYALLSGRWASECITGCVQENDFSVEMLSTYKKTLDREMAYDMAVSNLLIQITRNRTFTPFWMEILKIVFERARHDKEYAAVIAGIFDGSLPSYTALNPTFIVKSVIQGGFHFGSNVLEGFLQGPAHWIRKRNETRDFGKKVLGTIRENPRGQVDWLAGVARKGLRVGGHVLRNIKSN